jgi:hypothetical protein
MISFKIEDFESDLRRDMLSGTISGKILLDRFCVIEENSRRSPAYMDDRYSGFYYHLGKRIDPESLLEMNFDLGLLSGSLMVSCKTVIEFLGFRERGEQYFSPRIGRYNVRKVMKGHRDFYVGSLYDDEFDMRIRGVAWDFALVSDLSSSERQLEYLDFVWPHIADNGIIACENLGKNNYSEDGFLSFCQSKNRKAHIFPTRYGTGLVQK